MENIQKLFSARQLLMEYLTEHEARCTRPHCREVANMLAFLAHSLRFKIRDDGQTLATLVVMYDGECARNDCIHYDDTAEKRAERIERMGTLGKLRPTLRLKDL